MHSAFCDEHVMCSLFQFMHYFFVFPSFVTIHEFEITNILLYNKVIQRNERLVKQKEEKIRTNCLNCVQHWH